jgi:hypothetical protein
LPEISCLSQFTSDQIKLGEPHLPFEFSYLHCPQPGTHMVPKLTPTKQLSDRQPHTHESKT